MNTSKITDSRSGIKQHRPVSVGEKINWVLLAGMLAYLFIAK